MVILRVAPFITSHTAQNITELIQNIVADYSIPSYKVHAIAHDNAANMLKGIRDTGYLSISCFLHTTQLIINDVIFQQRIIKDALSISLSIVTHFSHSSIACDKLGKIQKDLGLAEHKLIQDVPTRWNSTYLMVDRLVSQKAAILTYCGETPNVATLDGNKWALLTKLCGLLKIFNDITQRLSKQTATASEILPSIFFIKMFFDDAASKQRSVT